MLPSTSTVIYLLSLWSLFPLFSALFVWSALSVLSVCQNCKCGVYHETSWKAWTLFNSLTQNGCWGVIKTWEVLWGKTSHLLEVLYNQFAGTKWSNLLCKKVGGFLIRCTYIVGSIVLKGRSLIGLWLWGERMGLVGKELLGQLKSDNIVEIGRSL